MPIWLSFGYSLAINEPSWCKASPGPLSTLCSHFGSMRAWVSAPISYAPGRRPDHAGFKIVFVGLVVSYVDWVKVMLQQRHRA